MTTQPDEQRPIPMLLFCPVCSLQHLDKVKPEQQWDNPPHRSHRCDGCGHVWRPADVPTDGVAAIATKGKLDGSPAPVAAARIAELEGERDALRADLRRDMEPHVAFQEVWRSVIELSDDPRALALLKHGLHLEKGLSASRAEVERMRAVLEPLTRHGQWLLELLDLQLHSRPVEVRNALAAALDALRSDQAAAGGEEKR